MAHTKEWYEDYAKEKGYDLTDIADKVIEAVDKCEGYCPCRYAIWKKTKTKEEMESIKCPCIYIEEDMVSNKKHTCHCNLFKMKEPINDNNIEQTVD